MTGKQVALPVRTERLESKLQFTNERTFLLYTAFPFASSGGGLVRTFIERTTGNGLALQLSPNPPGTTINFVPVHTLQVIPGPIQGCAPQHRLPRDEIHAPLCQRTQLGKDFMNTRTA